MSKITPVGQKLLVHQIKTEHHQTDAGIFAVDTTLVKGKVQEVSTELAHLYKYGDIVIFPDKTGINQPYKGDIYLWLTNNDIWGVETKDEEDAK